MLGGTFGIALLRNSIGAGIIMAVFLLLDRPKYSMKLTIWIYSVFMCAAITAFSFWYLYSSDTFVRFSSLLCIPVIGTFCIKMSADTLYLSMYRFTLGFYILSVVVFFGVNISRIFFGSSIWADIIVRFVMAAVIVFIIASRVRKSFLCGIDYLCEEMDWFSSVTVFLSILTAGLVAFWPGTHKLSMFHIVCMVILFFMAGMIQYMVFQIYLHQGKERRYQRENELFVINERLMLNQLELLRESERKSVRIRHDVRHHCLLMEEYIKKREFDKLSDYVQQYREDVESRSAPRICGNDTINSILSVYERRAREKNIDVTMKVRVSGEIAVRDIDLTAILANIFENAIQGCTSSGEPAQSINISVTRKGKKIVIQCRNTCARDLKDEVYAPKPGKSAGIGISSILKVVSYYNGESEFSINDGIFVARILLNIPESFQEVVT